MQNSRIRQVYKNPWQEYITIAKKINQINDVDYSVQNSTLSDFNFIYWLYEEAINYHKRNNYVSWSEIDPQFLKKEIEKKLHYKIVKNGDILCVFAIAFSDPIIWRTKDQGNAAYLHRIVVNPNFKGQRQFSKVLKWAIDYALANKLSAIRMDTWTKNPKIIEFYKHYGFKFIEEYITPDTPELPPQHRNLEVTLLEYKI